jgi:hypothetical protein
MGFIDVKEFYLLRLKWITKSYTAIKLRNKHPLLLDRVRVRRIIRQKALFDPLILTFSLCEKGRFILNLMTVSQK